MAVLSSGAEPFSNFGKGLPKKHFYEIVLKSGHWSRRRWNLKGFLVLALAAILSGQRANIRKFGRGLPKEHVYEIILKSGHWPGRIYRLKVFYFKLWWSFYSVDRNLPI